MELGLGFKSKTYIYFIKTFNKFSPESSKKEKASINFYIGATRVEDFCLKMIFCYEMDTLLLA